ncbi:MAG: FeoB-associated Cys-rich membrane protein [Bacteroidia bacterium]|nr:FeoB-associated Cys-rich membrane protein [Bacteroidia bacterium]
MNTSSFLVIALVSASVIYLALRYLFKRKQAACGRGCGCESQITKEQK